MARSLPRSSFSNGPPRIRVSWVLAFTKAETGAGPTAIILPLTFLYVSDPSSHFQPNENPDPQSFK